ncbi:ALF repeat-containing protein [Streptomyces sp. NPDC096339]|uniref:ALF repeat-containing protein n=1 Tax=Streptomyces sp. NPDC096339 TaxID=3366086 RepID=UPI0038084085
MNPTRAALVLASAALAPALLLSTPSFAATAAPATGTVTAPYCGTTAKVGTKDSDNAFAIIKLLTDPNCGKAVRREANTALSGTPADRVAFLTTGLAVAQDEDNKVAILRILAGKPGRGVTREANKALSGTAADRAAFRKTGLRLAQAEDDRVTVARILARPGISDALRAAANKAMDGTPEELRHFVTVGQYQV